MSRPSTAASPTNDGATLQPPDGHAGHAVQFYENDAFLGEVMADFASEGLRAGDAVAVLATAPHRQTLERLLGARGFDVDQAIASGQLFLLDAGETMAAIMSDGMPDRDRFETGFRNLLATVTAGGRRPRIYGELVGVLLREDKHRAAIQLEEMTNIFLKSHPIPLLCGYSMDHFVKASHADAFKRVCDVHTHVRPSEDYWRARDVGTEMYEVARLQQRARALEDEVKQRHELESALREALDREQVAHRAKDHFLAMLGHELRNPLGVIVLALDLMRLQLGNAAAAEREVVERQVKLLVRLVDDLLDAARLTHDKLPLKTEPIELAQIVESAIEIAVPLIRGQRHTLDFSVPAQGLVVEADRQRLMQAVGNIVMNAAKYTAGGGIIRIEGERRDGRVILRVADNGVGIPADLLPRVFEPFVQGERDLDRRDGGLGMGLAIARRLIELHGGTIAARSDGPGQGTELTISLPAAAAPPPEPSPPHPGPPPDGAPGARHVLKVLVVDDNVHAAQMIGDAVRALGHEVAVAHDAPAALAALSTFAADVGVLDIGLPGIDGYELARRIRARPDQPAMFLVALTGYGGDVHRIRSRAAGFDAHMVKPIDVPALSELLRGAADARKATAPAG
jgi:signal transduction histidine kinase/ActR/RegA family two-component response regulator